MSKKELIAYIANLTKGKISLSLIISNIIKTEVIQNDFIELNNNLVKEKFLHYPFYLQIEPIKKRINPQYISEISNLLINFKTNLRNAVAVCNFENKLPIKLFNQ